MMKRILIMLWALLVVMPGIVAAADQVYFYHTDPAGTPLAMSNAGGTVVWTADYKPFGEENSVTAEPKNNKRFVGKEKDEETGLSYFGARYEDARIGRFIAVDSVRAVDAGSSKTNEKILLNPQSQNAYAYSLNNPYRYIDKAGLWGSDVHSGIDNGKDAQYGTYFWLKKRNLSSQVSKIIAFYDDATDGWISGFYTGFAPWGEQWRHFNISPPKGYSDSRIFIADQSLIAAAKLYLSGNKMGSYKILGQGLHSLQDYFSHRDYVPIFGLYPHPKWFDKVADERNCQALKATEIATYNYIDAFLRLTQK